MVSEESDLAFSDGRFGWSVVMNETFLMVRLRVNGDSRLRGKDEMLLAWQIVVIVCTFWTVS
jgi:hypothetical protein